MSVGGYLYVVVQPDLFFLTDALTAFDLGHYRTFGITPSISWTTRNMPLNFYATYVYEIFARSLA